MMDQEVICNIPGKHPRWPRTRIGKTKQTKKKLYKLSKTLASLGNTNNFWACKGRWGWHCTGDPNSSGRDSWKRQFNKKTRNKKTLNSHKGTSVQLKQLQFICCQVLPFYGSVQIDQNMMNISKKSLSPAAGTAVCHRILGGCSRDSAAVNTHFAP